MHFLLRVATGQIQRHLVGPVGAEDQNAARGHTPSQVKEKTGRGSVRPLEIIQQEEEGLAVGYCGEHLRVVFNELVLLPCRTLYVLLLQLGKGLYESAHLVRWECAQPRLQLRDGYKVIEKAWAVFDKRTDNVG